eukprot:scaffold14498_cov61-Attheya_sp.AAC.1
MMRTGIRSSFRNSITSSSNNCTAESKEILSLVESAIHNVDKTLLTSCTVTTGVNDNTNKRNRDISPTSLNKTEQRNSLTWIEVEELFPVSSKATKKRKMNNDTKDKKNDKWTP